MGTLYSKRNPFVTFVVLFVSLTFVVNNLVEDTLTRQIKFHALWRCHLSFRSLYVIINSKRMCKHLILP